MKEREEGLVENGTTKAMEKENLSRSLKNRHIQMIAIGSAIGVGLFYGSTGSIAMAGPAVILGYLLVGIMIFFIMRAVGEMAVAEPVSGAYVSYGSRYIHPFIGFFMVWTSLIGMLSGAGAEYNALGHYVQYWFPNVPIWVTALVVLAILSIASLISVKIYGEMEFWLSIVKVTAIILLIIFGLLIICFGVAHGGQPIGFGNLVANGGFFAGGFQGFLFSLVMIAFAFGGVESLSITAGEAVDAQKTIPKAINSVFVRILIFYVGAIFVMLCLQPWNNIGTNGSPFVTVFSQIGIPAAASIINFVVITASLSAQNASIYQATRVSYNLGLSGQAPKAFTKVTKRNVPWVTGVIVLGLQLVSILINGIIPQTAFQIFAGIMVSLLIVIWLMILISQLRFRKAKIKSGEADSLKFKMPFWPYSNYIAIAFIALIIVVMLLIPDFRFCIISMAVWIVIMLIVYAIVQKTKKVKQENK